ncbi:MAG: pentapeptide repeat-containing protein [Bacilli bacterium]
MKLNEEQKREIREEIESKLRGVEVSSRLSIDKKLLEQLIFDIKDNGIKIISWSGDFLSKIDLSEVSFDNVWWQGDKIVLDNTNAIIDFSKGIFSYTFGEKMENCSFENMDLTDSNINKVSRFDLVNFDGAKLPEDFFENKDFRNCSFKNVDLKLDINSYELYNRFYRCNFSNTNLSITHSIRNITEEEKKEYKRYNELFEKTVCEGTFNKIFLSDAERQEMRDLEEKTSQLRKYLDVKDNLENAINDDMLIGCTVNGEIIKSQSEKEDSFENFKKSLLDSFDKKIIEQESKEDNKTSQKNSENNSNLAEFASMVFESVDNVLSENSEQYKNSDIRMLVKEIFKK